MQMGMKFKIERLSQMVFHIGDFSNDQDLM